MNIRKLSLPRRTLLRGAGAMIALPILDAMTPALAQTADRIAPVKRLGVMYVPNGMSLNYWTPKTTGALELTPILQPLAPFRDRLLVLSGMNAPPGGGGGHSRASTAFLTGTPPGVTSGGAPHAEISIDQTTAQHFGQHTQLPSLELGLDSLDGAGEVNVYGHEFDTALPEDIKKIVEKVVTTQNADEKAALQKYMHEGVKTVSHAETPASALYAVAFAYQLAFR